MGLFQKFSLLLATEYKLHFTKVILNDRTLFSFEYENDIAAKIQLSAFILL